MTSNLNVISRRSILGGLAATAAAAPALGVSASRGDSLNTALLQVERPRAVLMTLDVVPAWRGPGLYEVEYVDGPRIVFIEQETYPLDNNHWWFRASECLAHREDRGSWSMPETSLALMSIKKVGEIELST